jgi:hypothetical protein
VHTTVCFSEHFLLLFTTTATAHNNINQDTWLTASISVPHTTPRLCENAVGVSVVPAETSTTHTARLTAAGTHATTVTIPT